MSPEQKLLIVIDPAAVNHPTLNRVRDRIQTNHPNYNPEIVVLFAHEPSREETAGEASTYWSQQQLESLLKPLTDLGVSPTYFFSWGQSWAESVLNCAQAQEVTSIMVSNPGKGASKTISDEFWYLIRSTHVPVGILQDQPYQVENRKVLMSMDLQDKQIEGLNRRIFDTAKTLSSIFGAELHLANAYRRSSSYPDRAKLVALTGLANENIHLQAGEPDEALREIAQSLSPNLIVIGATRRTGLRAALRGRKIGEILKNITQDLLVVA